MSKEELVKVRVIGDSYRLSVGDNKYTEYRRGAEIEVPRSEVQRVPWALVDIAAEKRATETKAIDNGTERHMKQRAAFKAEREAAEQARLIRAEREAVEAQRVLDELRKKTSKKV